LDEPRGVAPFGEGTPIKQSTLAHTRVRRLARKDAGNDFKQIPFLLTVLARRARRLCSIPVTNDKMIGPAERNAVSLDPHYVIDTRKKTSETLQTRRAAITAVSASKCEEHNIVKVFHN